MTNISTHLAMLGLRVEDRVTGFKGVCTSVSFDLYGCVQAIVNPGQDKAGKLGDSQWYDIGRLKVLDKTPVMPRPDWEAAPPAAAEGRKGPAEKPVFGKP